MSTMLLSLSSVGVTVYYGIYPFYLVAANAVTILTSALQGV